MSNYPPPGYPQGQPAPGYPQAGYPPPQPRSGCGGCLGKFLIFLGVVFVLIIAMCCGGIFYARQYFASSMTKQPAEVQKISDEIISVTVPAPLEPVGGGRFRMPLVGTPLGQGVLYSDKNQKNLLILASIGAAFGPQLKEQVLQALESGTSQKQASSEVNEMHEELKDVKKTKIEPTILGEKAVFDITEGIGVQSNKKKIRVQGRVPRQDRTRGLHPVCGSRNASPGESRGDDQIDALVGRMGRKGPVCQPYRP